MAVESKKRGRGYKPPEPSAKDEAESSKETFVADPVENYADQPESKPYQDALKLYTLVQRAYDNKEDQDDDIEEFWNIFSAIPDQNQQYDGNTQGYVPAVRDAINARSKRALKQLFPANNKHVEGVSSDGKSPNTQLQLLEHYIRKTHLKTVVRSDLIAGDVTGQWNLLLDWTKDERTVTKLVRRNSIMETVEGEEIDIPSLDDEEERTEEEDIVEEGPEVVDFATQDLAVIPPTCTNLQKAHAVSLKLRLSPDAVRTMVDQGVFILPEGSDIEEFCRADERRDRKNPDKKATKDAGIKTQGTDKHCVIYWVMTKLDFGDDYGKCEAFIYFAGPTEIVGIIKNPIWGGFRPILSEPVERKRGSFFGISKIEPVKWTQWNLNDFWCMGQDSAMFSLLPVLAVDPLQTPQWANLVVGLSAVLPVAPGNIKELTRAQLWKESAQMVDMMKKQIWESMDVNEMMMGRTPQGRKNNQLIGGMQQESQINISDHASRYEEVMLNPLLEMLFEFDQQYRTKPLMIEQRGEIGYKAAIEEIPIPQWGQKYFFRWVGSEFMQSMQRMQQQIAFMNVLKSIPPQALNGYTIDVTPILQEGTNNLFGPELGARILVDKRNQYAVPPEIENEMLHNQFTVIVHEADDDQAHLRSHMQAAAQAGDPLALFKTHMMGHMEAIQKKRAMQNPQAQGLPGGPGGSAPGVAGTPRPGALPAPGRPAQNPPGAVQQDQMADGAVMGRG